MYYYKKLHLVLHTDPTSMAGAWRFFTW